MIVTITETACGNKKQSDSDVNCDRNNDSDSKSDRDGDTGRNKTVKIK